MVIILLLRHGETGQDGLGRVPLNHLLLFTKTDLVSLNMGVHLLIVITYKVHFRLGDYVDFINPTVVEV